MKLSVIDLSTILPGESRHDAFLHSIEIAQHVERLGYFRIWAAEHHGGQIGAGRAPEVVIAAMGAQTFSIRLGSGAVQLNHYSPILLYNKTGARRRLRRVRRRSTPAAVCPPRFIGG